MKKILLIICTLFIFSSLFGCQKEEEKENLVQMGNPWTDHAALKDAESAVGFPLEIPETIGAYTAEVFRVLNGELLEVRYINGDSEVTVRKQAGEGQDISGDYTQYPTVSLTDADGYSVEARTDGTVTSAIISTGGYSYSVYAPCSAAEEFISAITGK